MGAKVHPGGKKPPMTGNEAHVFVKSPNAERAKQLCAIAEKCGFASSITRTRTSVWRSSDSS